MESGFFGIPYEVVIVVGIVLLLVSLRPIYEAGVNFRKGYLSASQEQDKKAGNASKVQAKSRQLRYQASAPQVSSPVQMISPSEVSSPPQVKPNIDKSKVRIFLSYRRAPTWGQARAIANDLEARGAEVFFDVDSINDGHFATVIAEAIRRCDYFVLVVAPDTLQSEWVQREVLAAQQANKMIIPLLVNGAVLDAAQMPESLRFVGSYNAIQLIPEYYNEGIERLASRFLKL